MDLFSYVGERIRDLRKSFASEGLSQEALALKLEVATNTVSRWETATYHPSLKDLEHLATFFNVSVLSFFPKEEKFENKNINALLRAAQNLPEKDIEELRRYAEFRKARSLYKEHAKPNPGRKRKTEI